MIKKYDDTESEPMTATAEPVAAYEACSRYHVSAKDTDIRERIMASTVSIDEYFDELVSLVHKD